MSKMLEAILTSEFQSLFNQWGSNQPPRLGLRASSLLVPAEEWCVRQHVLSEISPVSERETEEHTWRTNAVFLHGWKLHEKWQGLFFNAQLAVQNMEMEGQLELDLTHHDHERGIYFSPDAILEYAGRKFVVEIKGINTKDFQLVKDATLEEAMKLNKSIRGAVPQANLYCHLAEIKQAIILAEDKNTQEFRLWLLDYQQPLAWPYTERAEQVKGALIVNRAKGLVPDRICQTITDSRAKRCPMRKVCFTPAREVVPQEIQKEEEIGYDD